MKKIFINAPILSRSGYGEMARFALRALRQHEDKFDIYLGVLTWGQTGFLFEENEEYEYITKLRIKTDQYVKQAGGNPQFDISLQITIPNEWKKMAPINIGYTAGIETTHISPAWLQPSQQMDKIIVISEHAKRVFENTVFNDQNGNQHKVTTPIEVVHFPWKQVHDAGINLELKTEFNFLTVNQWGPRKNIEGLISAFIDEFRDEEVGLVVKTNKAADSQMDKNVVHTQMQQLIESKGPHKCKVYVVHGTLSEQEMHGLYRHPKVKAFVTATHGEGFGLPVFEAVNEELPVIATNWSGHLDFLNGVDKEGELKSMFAKVDFEIKPIQDQFVWQGVMEKGVCWAYPSVGSLRSRMREVYKDYPRFKSWAKKISQYNKEKFEEQKVYNDFFYSLGVYSLPKKLEIKPITGLSFCIPTNGKRIEKTKLTINSIKKQNWGGMPYEIIICGDISPFTDIQEVILLNKSDDAHSRKVSVLRNAAAKATKFENIVFCDDDILLSQDWLEKTIKYSAENEWEVLGNKILNPDGTRHWDRGTLIPRKLVDYNHPDNDKNLMQTSGFFLMRKETFLNNIWDETKLVYADRNEQQIPEDVQFNLDLHKKNTLLKFNKEATVWHNDDNYSSLNINNLEQTLTKSIIKNYNKNIIFPDIHFGFTKLIDDLKT